jgi:hypothetical protein
VKDRSVLLPSPEILMVSLSEEEQLEVKEDDSNSMNNSHHFLILDVTPDDERGRQYNKLLPGRRRNKETY